MFGVVVVGDLVVVVGGVVEVADVEAGEAVETDCMCL